MLYAMNVEGRGKARRGYPKKRKVALKEGVSEQAEGKKGRDLGRNGGGVSNPTTKWSTMRGRTDF